MKSNAFIWCYSTAPAWTLTPCTDAGPCLPPTSKRNIQTGTRQWLATASIVCFLGSSSEGCNLGTGRIRSFSLWAGIQIGRFSRSCAWDKNTVGTTDLFWTLLHQWKHDSLPEKLSLGKNSVLNAILLTCTWIRSDLDPSSCRHVHMKTSDCSLSSGPYRGMLRRTCWHNSPKIHLQITCEYFSIFILLNRRN